MGIDQKSGLPAVPASLPAPAAAAFSGLADTAGGGAGAIGERSAPQAITTRVTAIYRPATPLIG